MHGHNKGKNLIESSKVIFDECYKLLAIHLNFTITKFYYEINLLQIS